MFDTLEAVVDQAITDLRSTTNREVEKVLTDRWFYTVDVVNVLKKYRAGKKVIVTFLELNKIDNYKEIKT